MIVMILQHMKTLCLYEIILVVAPPGNKTESIPDTTNAFKFLMTPRQQEPRKGKKGGRKGRKRSRLFKSLLFKLKYRARNSGLAVQGTLCPVAQLFEGTFKFFRGRHFALLPEFLRALSKFWGAVNTSI